MNKAGTSHKNLHLFAMVKHKALVLDALLRRLAEENYRQSVMIYGEFSFFWGQQLV